MFNVGLQVQYCTWNVMFLHFWQTIGLLHDTNYRLAVKSIATLCLNWVWEKKKSITSPECIFFVVQSCSVACHFGLFGVWYVHNDIKSLNSTLSMWLKRMLSRNRWTFFYLDSQLLLAVTAKLKRWLIAI